MVFDDAEDVNFIQIFIPAFKFRSVCHGTRKREERSRETVTPPPLRQSSSSAVNQPTTHHPPLLSMWRNIIIRKTHSRVRISVLPSLKAVLHPFLPHASHGLCEQRIYCYANELGWNWSVFIQYFDFVHI